MRKLKKRLKKTTTKQLSVSVKNATKGVVKDAKKGRGEKTTKPTSKSRKLKLKSKSPLAGRPAAPIQKISNYSKSRKSYILKERIVVDNHATLTPRQIALLSPKEKERLEPKLHWQSNQFIRRRGTCDAVFTWTPKRILCARLLANCELSVPQIAKTLEIHKQTVYYWLTYTEFHDMVNKLVLETGLATEPERIAILKKRETQINKIINKRLAQMIENLESDPANGDMFTDQLLRNEQRILELLDKNKETTVHHTFDTLNPDIKKVHQLQDIAKQLPESAAKEFKAVLVQRAQAIIDSRKKQEEERMEGKTSE